MGRKVHPIVFRLGGIYSWPGKWFTRKNFAQHLREDVVMRAFIIRTLKGAGVTRVEVERSVSGVVLNIFAAKPGMIIGRGGAQIESLKKNIKALVPAIGTLTINIQELEKPLLHAGVTMEAIQADLEKRVPFRTTLKQSLARVNKAGALGAKITVSGRLNGAEIARDESLSFGSLPLQNLRADIDYSFGEANTIYGKIGIKVWVYRGEIFNNK